MSTTECNRGCGTPVDLTKPHVTVVRHVEQQHGDVVDVRESAEVAAFHQACAPTVDNLLDGLVDGGHVPAHGSTA